jgi:outer membrane autotransporter barrel domain
MQNVVCRRLAAILVALTLSLSMAHAASLTPNAASYAASAAVNGAAVSSDPWTLNNSTAEIYAAAMHTSISTQRIFREAFPSVADYSQTAHRQSTEENCGLVPGSICAPGKRWVMWDTPWIQKDKRKSKDGYLGYDYESSGFATGFTYLLDDKTEIGFAVGYDYRELEGRDGYYQKVKGDSFHAALYGGKAIGPLFLDAYAGFSWTSQRAKRGYIDSFNNQAVDTNGNYNDTILSAGFKASQVYIVGNDIRITPAIGFDFSRISTNNTTESGSRGNLQVAGDSYNSFQTPITVAVNKTFQSNFLAFGGVCSLWTPEVRGGYVPQFGSKRSDVSAIVYNVDPQPFAINSQSAKQTGSYGTVGAGMKIQIKDKFIFGLDYDYRFGSKYDSHVITGTYGVCF